MTTDIFEALRAARPNLSDNSLKTYVSTLKNIYKRVFPDDTEIDIMKFNDHKKFIDVLKNLENNKRKSILSALVVISSKNGDGVSVYRDLMIKDVKKYNEDQLKNEKTESQKENWVDQDEIKKLFDLYQNEANKTMKIKEDLTMPQLQTIQNYIILCLCAGIYIAPRRSIDWTYMKWRNYDANIDNYYSGPINKKVFVFNKYKTAKFYHKQNIDVPTELKNILNKWTKRIRSDYILFDSNNNQMSPVKLNQRINKIFDKKVGVNILRHSYITAKYDGKAMPTLKDITETAEQMSHGLKTHLEYIKKGESDDVVNAVDTVKEDVQPPPKKIRKRGKIEEI